MQPVFASFSARCQNSTLITARRPCALRLILLLAILLLLFPQPKFIQNVHTAGSKTNIQHGSVFSKSNVTSMTKEKPSAKLEANLSMFQA